MPTVFYSTFCSNSYSLKYEENKDKPNNNNKHNYY